MITRVSNLEVDANAYTRQLVDSFRERYQCGRDSWTEEPAMARVAEILLASLPPGPHRVLDVGTGRGRDVELFLRAGHQATGLDIVSVPEWQALRERWGTAVTLVESPFTAFRCDLPFTAVLDNGCFHHQHPSEYATYLAHMRDLMDPGALALFSVFTPDEETEPGAMFLTSEGRINREFSALQLVTLAEQAGFEAVSSHRLRRGDTPLHYLATLFRRP